MYTVVCLLGFFYLLVLFSTHEVECSFGIFRLSHNISTKSFIPSVITLVCIGAFLFAMPVLFNFERRLSIINTTDELKNRKITQFLLEESLKLFHFNSCPQNSRIS